MLLPFYRYVCVGHSCPTKQLRISTALDVHASQTSRCLGVHNTSLLGQECPSHTFRCTPSAFLLRGCTNIVACFRIIRKPIRAMFVTFCKNNRELFSPRARDAILQCCLKGNGSRFHLHAAVIMPEHAHLLLTPAQDDDGWVYGLPAILKAIKGASAPEVNKLNGTSGPVWQEESFDHVLRSQESRRKAGIYPTEPCPTRFGYETRRLPVALG